MVFVHIPILAREIADLLVRDVNGSYFDGTLGLGGHTKVILARLGPAGRVIGLDKDARAIAQAVANVGDARLQAHKASYLDAPQILAGQCVAGALFDLGLSSYQLDDATRGFSFMQDGPLDMRFDDSCGPSAADIINTYPADKLEDIFNKYGEERAARQIALAIYEARRVAPIATTSALARVVERVNPRTGKTHPATKVFQALRIAVNGELAAVEALPKILGQILEIGARAAVLTFHSTEDRIIKNAFKELAASGGFKLVNKKVIEPDYQEIRANPRARSAKLRVIEKL